MPLGAVLLTVLAFYAPFLGRGFVSEDFLLVRLHLERPPWRDPLGLFAGPWLGLTDVFRFYRPVASLLFGFETALFGGWSPGYHALHLGVFLGLVALVFRLLQRVATLRDGDGSAGSGAQPGVWLGALFFALYPLAPNSVSWVSAFPNLFGAFFTVLAAERWVAWTSTGRRRTIACSVVAFGCALGCYESAVALPAWLLLFELVRDGSRSSQRRALPALGLVGLLAAAYLAWRRHLFGEVLGGYGELADRLRDADPTLLATVPRSLLRLPAPWFGVPRPAIEVAAAVCVAALLAAWCFAQRGKWAAWRPAVLGVGWAVVFLAPFRFELVWPANGRYWTLASIGMALLPLALLQRPAGPSHGGRRVLRHLAVAAILMLVARNATLLLRHLDRMDRAADLAGAIADEIGRVASDETVFVTDVPRFVRDGRGVNWAQVFHYGLRDAVAPPHRSTTIDAVPLPWRSEADVRRLALDHQVWRWDDERGRLVPLRPRRSQLPPLLEVAGPAPEDGLMRVEDLAAVAPRIVDPPAGSVTARVVLVAGGNSTVATHPLPPLDPPFPAAFAALWNQLDPGRQWWWVETRDAANRVTAVSGPALLDLRPVTDR
jgi:hypothetical protein